MKKMVLGPLGVFLLYAVSLANPVLAAELLDVKPVVTGSQLIIEVTADIPMTYTYYKVPGQARAVVDIADADPEKVEPLIVVNKGAVASISVDKAVIGDMGISRLVFNLVSESEISVNHSPDRKTLNVSFGGGKSATALPVTAPPAPVAEPIAVPAPVAPAVPVIEPKESAAVATSPITASKEEDDPLGLDEPQPAAVPATVTAPAAVHLAKLEPVVPVTVDKESPSPVVVKGIVVGASFIEIQTNGPVGKFKQHKLASPERLSIEVSGTSSVNVSTIQVKRFGVSKVRIGATPGLVRVVLDTAKSSFPKYEIVSVEKGLRVNFK